MWCGCTICQDRCRAPTKKGCSSEHPPAIFPTVPSARIVTVRHACVLYIIPYKEYDVMFATIGRIADKNRFVLLVGWIAAAVLVTLLAPNLDDVTSNDQTDFLPEDASSLAAQETVEQYFPQRVDNGMAVLVFDAGDGKQITDQANFGFIGEVSEWLSGSEAPAHVQSVLSPTLNPEAAGNLLSA